MWQSKKIYTLLQTKLKTLLNKCGSEDICKEDQILIVDYWPLKHMQNLELACIFPFSYMNQKVFERALSRGIGNIAIHLLVYLIPLILYAIVFQYVRDHVHIEQLHHLKDQD